MRDSPATGSSSAPGPWPPDRGGAVARAEPVCTAEALEQLRPEWEHLWAAMPAATPFQSAAWLLPWWKHLGRGTLATIAMRSATRELVGLAPLYVHADRASGLRHLWPIGIGTTDCLDLLVRPGWEAAVTQALAAHLREHAQAWDVLEFPQLRASSCLLQLAGSPGWRHELAADEPHPVLALDGVDVESRLPKAMRDNLRYYRGRARRAAALRFECAGPQQVPAWLDALARLHARRWSLRGEAGVLGDPGVVAAHREAGPLLHDRGLLRLHALLFDDEIVAVLYCLMDKTPAHEPRCSYYIGGFDPRFAACSPGTLLVAHAIACAAAEGATRFDFLRGREAYKYRWGAVDEPMFAVRVSRLPGQ